MLQDKNNCDQNLFDDTNIIVLCNNEPSTHIFEWYCNFKEGWISI